MSELLEQIKSVVGESGLLVGDDVRARPNEAWGQGECPAKAIVRPRSTDELAEVMRLCHGAGQTVVPWGGLTGLVNGTRCEPQDIALSVERMNRVEHLDENAGIMTVQAGVPLQTVQEAAQEAGWLFPMDLGARGSATIGGTIATNAGGNNVVRYGMMREQVLGLEAVLADGTVLSSMNEVLKNNTGYDLKHLFIGSEGTLGIVTRAVLRLRPRQPAVQTAFVAMDDFTAVYKLLNHLGVALEGKLSAFEVMWNNHYRLLVEESERHPAVLPPTYPYYVLLESTGSVQEREEEQFMEILGELLEQGLIADAVIAQSEGQSQALWQMRDDVEAFVLALYPLSAFDVSLPIRYMEEYVSRVEKSLAADHPDARMVVFGHLGDGNIHLGIGPHQDKAAIDCIVYDNLQAFTGSVSAEHGIGLEKKDYLDRSRSDIEIAVMRQLKNALDPAGLLNPGKVL